jgi:hypothetical protein
MGFICTIIARNKISKQVGLKPVPRILFGREN